MDNMNFFLKISVTYLINHFILRDKYSLNFIEVLILKIIWKRQNYHYKQMHTEKDLLLQACLLYISSREKFDRIIEIMLTNMFIVIDRFLYIQINQTNIFTHKSR